MPDDIIAANDHLVTSMFGGIDEMHFLCKVDKNGNVKKGKMLVDIEAVASRVRLSCDPAEPLKHYCYVREGSPEHVVEGRAVGSACCDDRSESIEKIAVPIINALVHHGWEDGEADRWFFVIRVFKRILFGFLACGALPEAMKKMQTTWNIDESMKSTLERLLAADSGDFYARTRLRLLSITRAFCVSPSVGSDIATVVISFGQVDPLLFQMLGTGDRKRARLGDLVDEENSLIAIAQQRLLHLLEE